jgi:putative transcriptional regulator
MNMKKFKRSIVKNERLINLRDKFHLTQEQVGQAVELTQSMISHIEAGRKDPGSFYKKALENFYNEMLNEIGEQSVTIDWLFYEQINDLKSLKKSA